MLKVSYHYVIDGRLVYIEDVVSQAIMDDARNILQVKSLYCQEKGLKSSNLKGWEIKVDGEEED